MNEATSPTFEEFRDEAVSRTTSIGTQFTAYPSASFYPATENHPAFTNYAVQVWEARTPSSGIGVNCFIVSEHSPAKCLHKLGRELAALKAKTDYDAVHTNAPA